MCQSVGSVEGQRGGGESQSRKYLIAPNFRGADCVI